MRLTDAQLSIPLIILAITILDRVAADAVTRHPGAGTVGLAGLCAGHAERHACRSGARNMCAARKILGASDLRIMLPLIAPNILPPIAFVAVLDVARMMIFEAILGFIGIGVQPPTPTFGSIIADGTQIPDQRLVDRHHARAFPVPGPAVSINLMGASLERARNMLLRGTI